MPEGLNTSLWLTTAEVATYRLILEDLAIPDSDTIVKALARLAAKNAHYLPREFIFEQLAGKGKYPEQARELARISQEIAKIRKEYYPDESKYQEPPRVKLLRTIGDFQSVRAAQLAGEAVPREVALYELANVLYYNAQDWLQDHDIRSHDAVVELFAQEAAETPELALNAALAKYRCRLEHKDLKYREPEKARTMELAAIREVIGV